MGRRVEVHIPGPRDFFVAEDVIHHRGIDSDGRWISRCGWDFDDAGVEWAGNYEPDAWPPCLACVRESATREPMPEVGWPAAKPVRAEPDRELTRLIARWKVWCDVGLVSHRVAPANDGTAACGKPIPHRAAYRAKGPVPPVRTCSDCERVRAAARRDSSPVSKGIERPRLKPKAATRAEPRYTRKRKPAVDASPRKAMGFQTRKEIALFGRKMIVPIRIVGGGAPELGKRR